MRFNFLSNCVFTCVCWLTLLGCSNDKEKLKTAEALYQKGDNTQVIMICKEILDKKPKKGKTSQAEGSLFLATEKLSNLAVIAWQKAEKLKYASQQLESTIKEHYSNSYSSGYLSVSRELTEMSGASYNVTVFSPLIRTIPNSNELVGSAKVSISGIGSTLGGPQSMSVEFCDIWRYEKDAWIHEKDVPTKECDAAVEDVVTEIKGTNTDVTAGQK
jgi:hypothetical protein